ncbi:tRNA wybutosine-synthesizing protein 1 [Methanohalophilus levihalophilus]|uniref:4-demethylwyosine synthase TYW1 n=1 Tax=Methanohalophilus levihalophilus TaxID=1431282 RepID=UPI001AE32631|nr:4-demethylwyosine synthase TYW1 [Methanohalophilus levihalophilus]MBP2029920.1 tRNA wybutosine-synthesizing protein 1 [Methanohalophilus levihalophilus]
MDSPDLPEKTDINSLLKKQGYSLAGSHSAVKTCLWLRRSLREEGQCYKSQFYGITSHRCMQMTPTLICNQRCLHCWRPIEVDSPVPEKWDSPMEIVGSCIKSQQKLVSGFGGSASRELWEEANEPAHVAISLSGEPTMYPHLPELIEEFRKQGLSTFVVSNGTNPDMMEKISPSQLYMSLDAPDTETYDKVCNPKNPDLWERINQSLEILRKKDCRTAIRITLVKGVNMFNPEGYASLIKKADPDFVEVKAYMHLGFSRRRLERDAMPTHEEVEKFASQVADFLGYYLVDSSPISRVVLLSREAEYTKSLPL